MEEVRPRSRMETTHEPIEVVEFFRDHEGNIVKVVGRWKRLFHYLFDGALKWSMFAGLMNLDDHYPELFIVSLFFKGFILANGHLILTEYYLQRSFAKYLTRSKVVFREGVEPSFRGIFIRNIVRLNPSEPLSLMMGVDAEASHDSISNTRVVEEQPYAYIEGDTPIGS